MNRRLAASIFLAALAGGHGATPPAAPPAGAAARESDLAARVVIVANAREPESVRLAEFYAGKRGIPAANIVALDLPETESITWREFIDQVYQPLQDELVRRDWIDGTASNLLDRFGRKRYSILGHRLSYLVTCRGVPLRIHNDPTLLDEEFVAKLPPQFRTNAGAVDSELSLLAQSGYDITAVVPNPLFRNTGASEINAELVVKVARLDGPTWGDARKLVNSALEGERHGLLGRYYVDLQGPHPKGDQWLEATRRQIEQLGFDGDTERSGNTFAAAARFDAPVLYFGWYAGEVNGPFLREGFQFAPGAIALHIHSFSAATLHSATSNWTGPLVARGAAATFGNVFEPYLEYTVRPDLLFGELAAGHNLGDAAYFASPMLSWQAVVLGDPLYRPFKVSLAEQLKSLDRLPPTLSAYAVLRQANLLRAEHRDAEARAALQVAMRRAPHLALALALARTALAAHDPKAAVAAVEFARFLPQTRPEDWVLVREIAGILAAAAARPFALQVYAALARSPAPSPDARKEMLMEARACADSAGDLARSIEFGRLLNPPSATVAPPAGPVKPKQ
ncbi:MAG: TIGR03790 family protein [Opitutae bacterium]|nr:TIGR03790 family protein [Opitutae bacterium]